MNYAENVDFNITFELKEEFSIIINNSPVWFAFDDLERQKNLE